MAWVSDNYSAKFSKIPSHFFKNIPENFESRTVNWNAETQVLSKQKLYQNKSFINKSNRIFTKKVTCIWEQLHMFLLKGQFFI